MRLRIFLSGIMVALLLVTAGSGVLAQDGDEPLQPVFGAINIITADLYITPADGGEEARLIAPSSFDTGETLRTDENGTALITWFYDGTETVLAPNGSITLNGFSGNLANDYMIDMELHEGQMLGALGMVAAEGTQQGEWTIKTPAFTAHPLRGQFELSVGADGETQLLVTEGRVEVLVGDEDPFTVDGGQYLVGAPGVAESLSTDGITPNGALVNAGVCTANIPVNLNVRVAPNEDSRRLGGVSAGQILWVRAATEGQLWLQVYYETAEDDPEGHNYGWVYGPAVELNADNCTAILRAALDARMYGGPGIHEAVGIEGESDPIAEAD